MALDVARGRVHSLGCSEVVRIRVNEEARVKVVNRHRDRKVRVRLHRAQIGRENELRRRHVVHAGNHTHRRRVAGAILYLRAIREGQVDGRAEVDEVVGGRSGGDLTSLGAKFVSAVILEAGIDQRAEQCQ